MKRSHVNIRCPLHSGKEFLLLLTELLNGTHQSRAALIAWSLDVHPQSGFQSVKRVSENFSSGKMCEVTSQSVWQSDLDFSHKMRTAHWTVLRDRFRDSWPKSVASISKKGILYKDGISRKFVFSLEKVNKFISLSVLGKLHENFNQKVSRIVNALNSCPWIFPRGDKEV